MAVVAAVGLAAGLAQTLLAALQTKEVKEMCSMFRCETQLKKLENTMSTINALLLDVDSKRQGLTHEGQVWVEKLKDAVYDVDDLLDEFATIGQQRKQAQDAKFRTKAGNFFSRNNKYLVAFNVSQEIKMLREKLNAITKDHTDFGFTDVTKPVVVREETCSIISELEVIGREDDKEAIVGMLLSDSPLDRNVCFVNIVGVGGLGKTTLAQLVYNDERVEGAFSKRIWVCVSEQFGRKEILGKILGKEVINLEVAQGEVRSLLERKRYLIVLDDVWNESHEEWRNLKPFLASDVSGSKIIITTRSRKVATSIGEDSIMYELKDLSEESSWSLFKLIAFGKQREDHQVDPDLVDIGKEIVKKCANVPLSIRVIASLLYDQSKNKWVSLRSNDLADMSHEDDENSIMPTLMFSYYQLSPELKSCFSFCSLFPKDDIIKKELLISMWLAQGYLVATDNAQSIEDVGERYFTILLNRCFFQDIELDEHGDVYSFKMHDLMHDLALKVAGKESLFMAQAGKNHLRKKIRHLSGDWDCSNLCLRNTLRTYMWLSYPYARDSLSDEVTQIILKCKRLRVLSLPKLGTGHTLPERFGRLLHLRYLDLSDNGLEMLPKPITKLHNLQILILHGCSNLKELPEDINKLVNLRTLDISGCDGLSYMPRGMHNLTNLHRLTQFVVGGVDVKQIQGSKLVDLQAFRSLKGDLCITVLNFSSENIPDATRRAFILKDARLKNLDIECCISEGEKIEFDQSEVHETLIEDLCPNEDIRRISMGGYKGTKLPSWASLMESDMDGLQHVTSLSRFRCLKVLSLDDLPNVEYMEIENDGAQALASRSWEPRTFFPVIEKLKLIKMPKLKGWWRGLRWREMEGGGGSLVDAKGDIHIEHVVSLPYFPRLLDLTIKRCENMTYFPPCPHVKRLKLRRVNEALTFCMKGGVWSSNMSKSCFEKLEVYNARVMNSVLSEFQGDAIGIELRFDDEVKSMGVVREGFEKLGRGLKRFSIGYCKELDMEDEEVEGMPWKYLQSLSSLKLERLPKMKKLPKGLQYLTSLQSLEIQGCYNLEELGECIGFLTSLQFLRIIGCNKLKALPVCIGFLTSMQYLEISSRQLESLPESMRHLTSLTTLDIYTANDQLRERCRQPDGEDWPKICHIPNLDID
uniref:CC-NBS-LRR type resistance protein n=1 Tax=Beta vulgaris subsp. vulgaris TaxID=3555 RepID=J3SIC7_BETVV|nr:CC-NBS-LRR type resistance protein [Beta vulgaris subsp. vulgaris]